MAILKLELKKRADGFQWRVDDEVSGENIARGRDRQQSSAGCLLAFMQFIRDMQSITTTATVMEHEADGGT